jgi:hypothetical protein
MYGTIDSKDYTVEPIYSSTPVNWQLISGSNGCTIAYPDDDDLIGAITIQRASNDPDNFYDYWVESKVNTDTGIYEYGMYRSIKHNFYTVGRYYSASSVYEIGAFISASTLVTKSLAELPDNSYVISVGQNFYGDRIKPGSFELTIHPNSSSIQDDSKGNLFVDESGTITYIGNIFYNNGVAVVRTDTGSAVTSISSDGLTITSGSVVFVDYYTDIRVNRHEINVKLEPMHFNFSPYNPSLNLTFTDTGSAGSQFLQENIPTPSGSNYTWTYRDLMAAGAVKPYITTIGLYSESNELLAVAKLSEPIQRIFNASQIFIVRFDT